MRSRALLSGVLLLCCLGVAGAQQPGSGPIHVLAVVDPSLADVGEGIEQGVQEMERTASLLGRELRVTRVDGPVPKSLERLITEAGTAPLAIVYAGMPATPAVHEEAGVPVLALTPESAGSQVGSSEWVFLLRAAQQGSEWTPHLNRFGAGELNERYTRRVGRGMTADAWVGWFAIKAIVEAALRSQAADPAALAEALRTLRFDGHKGEPLYFDGAQRLVQPVYSELSEG